MNYKYLLGTLGVFSACSLVLSGCANSNLLSTPITEEDYKIDTIVSISSYNNVDTQIITDALSICDTYDDMLSMHKEGSVLWNINHNITTEMPAEMGQLINDALEYSSLSDGTFQITIGSVSELWDFSSSEDTQTVPSAEAIATALQYVDDSKISVYTKDDSDPNGTWVIEKPEETKLDLGAVAKGYIADKVKEYLLEHGVTNAIINLGGNILCVGDKGGEAFTIGVQKPFGSSTDTSALLSISDMSVISSGTYQRGFTGTDGKYYHHILDAKTGYPLETELEQTTIISNSSFEGDCLSTLTFTLGTDKGLELINNTDGIEAIFITDDGTLHYSDNADTYIK